MNYRSITRRAAGLAVLFAAVAGGPAQAAAPAGTASCAPPNYLLSQPFTSLGDSNWYTLAPGQSVDAFTAAGWTLSGGASLVTATLADGSLGTVLDLPAGATAVSPAMCVNSGYPDARLDIRQLSNGPGLHAYVNYTSGAGANQSSGNVNGSSTWSVSRAFQLHTSNLSGWQEARYTFVGDKGHSQVYDFYVDPRCFR